MYARVLFKKEGAHILCQRRATWLLKRPRILRPHRRRRKCFAICSRRHEEARESLLSIPSDLTV